MLPDGSAKDDVKLPDGDLGKQIQADFDDGKELIVTVVAAMGEELALSHKEAPKSCAFLPYRRDWGQDTNTTSGQKSGTTWRPHGLTGPPQHTCILFHGFCTLLLYQIVFMSLNQRCMPCISGAQT